jgi:uncharacterized damage-inducible protein DinB
VIVDQFEEGASGHNSVAGAPDERDGDRMATRFADMFVDLDQDTRVDPAGDGDEASTLQGFLRWQRETLELKCAGLDPEQLARRAVPPSTLSLLGLVRHLADVERSWFRRGLAGGDAPPLFATRADPDGDFNGAVADPEVVAQAWAAWRGEVEYADRFVAATPDLLSVSVADPDRGPLSLRWVLVHMIEEYARHIGHADLLRQLIDGRVGQ